jgi:hypothetical protein
MREQYRFPPLQGLSVAQLHSLGKDAQPVPVVVKVLTDERIFVVAGTLTVAQLCSLDEEEQSACAAAGALTDEELRSLGEVARPVPIVVEVLTDEQFQKLGEAVDMVPAVGGIPAAERLALLEAIAEVLPHYATSGEAYRRKFIKKRGPRPKFHRAHLLIDCQRAWQRATGRSAGLWVTQGCVRASVPVQLAHAVLPVVSKDRLHPSAWRSQCDIARRILARMRELQAAKLPQDFERILRILAGMREFQDWGFPELLSAADWIVARMREFQAEPGYDGAGTAWILARMREFQANYWVTSAAA